MEIGTTLFRLGAWPGLGVALLNLGYGLVRRRRVQGAPCFRIGATNVTGSSQDYLIRCFPASRVFSANMVCKMFIALPLVVPLHFIE
jgi:hypothetical protein